MSKARSTARRLNAEQKKRLWSQWRQGDSIAQIARSLGQYPASIRWTKNGVRFTFGSFGSKPDPVFCRNVRILQLSAFPLVFGEISSRKGPCQESNVVPVLGYRESIRSRLCSNPENEISFIMSSASLCTNISSSILRFSKFLRNRK